MFFRVRDNIDVEKLVCRAKTQKRSPTTPVSLQGPDQAWRERNSYLSVCVFACVLHKRLISQRSYFARRERPL